MNQEILKTVGQVAGIGGVALGVFLILFREVIRKNIFPDLSKDHAYRLLRLIVILVWSVAIAGIAAWVFVSVDAQRKKEGDVATPTPVSGQNAQPTIQRTNVLHELNANGEKVNAPRESQSRSKAKAR